MATTFHPTTLREITDHVISVFANRAGIKGNSFINDIPHGLDIKSDKLIVTSVLTGILSAVVSNTYNSCIRMSAKVFGSVVLLKVKDSNSSDIDQIEAKVGGFKLMAEKMRGSLYVTNQHKKLTTVTFGFPNAA